MNIFQNEGEKALNLTSFYNYGITKSNMDDFVIYLGGFHNRSKRDFLKKIYDRNNNKEYRHFGDIDACRFYILEHLKRKTGIPFVSMNMDKCILTKYMLECGYKLEQEAVKENC